MTKDKVKYYIYTYWVYDKFGNKVTKQKRVTMDYFKPSNNKESL